MEIRSIVVLRKAKDIEFVKRGNRAKSPTVFEEGVVKLAYKRNFIFLGFVGCWSGKDTRIAMVCDNGHVYVCRVGVFLKGHGCADCRNVANGNRNRKDGSTLLTELKLEAESRGDCEIVGFDGGYKNISVPNLIVRCFEHEEYKISPYNFLTLKLGCHECGGSKRKTEAVAIADVEREAGERGNCEFVCFEGGYVNVITRNLVMKCPIHDEYKTSYSGFVYSKCGCPLCATRGYKPSESAYIYVQKLSGGVDAIKFGITSNTKRRMYSQATKSKLKHELVFSYKFKTGVIARRVENEIKKKYREYTKYVSKDMMQDGYTETIPASLLTNFLKDVKSWCNIHR